VRGSWRIEKLPTVIIEDMEPNTQVTVIISELYEFDDDPNPPAEKPEDEEEKNVWLVSSQGKG
jgi:hypothetical protein